MNLNRYEPGLVQIRSVEENPSDSNWYKVRGYISDESTDQHYTRMAVPFLKVMAEATTNRDVPVLAHHAGDVHIGKSIRGKLTEDNQVEVDFGIRKELKLNSPGLSSSDDYFKSLDSGLIQGLSIGFRPDKISCDACQADMDLYAAYGFTFSRCDNGHYLGQKLYRDKEGKISTKKDKEKTEFRNTGLVHGGSLEEFSLTSFPSNRNAKILRDAREGFKAGKFSEEQLHQLSLNYGIKRSQLEDDHEPQIIPRGDTPMDNDKDRTDQDIFEGREKDELNEKIRRLEEEKRNLQTVADENLKKAEDAEARVSDLESEIAKLENIEEGYHKTREDVKEKDKFIEEANERLKDIRKNEYKVERYDSCLVDMRRAAKKAWGQANDDATQSEMERKHSEIDNCQDLGFLIERVQAYIKEARNIHSNRWKNTTSQRTEGRNPIDLDAFKI